MNLLQKAIIRKNTIKKHLHEPLKDTNYNEQTALKNGSKTLKKSLKNYIKALKQCPNESQDKYIAKAKLLLSALKGKAYADEQIDESLIGDFCFMAFHLWYTRHLKKPFLLEIESVANAAYDIEHENQNIDNA